ncbi:MAG: hypothetical protein AABX30_01465 [Nanoarchaeota archaeon]
MIKKCPKEWFEILTRIFCDNVPEKVDLVFLNAQTKDNEISSFNAGAKFYLEGFTPKIGITHVDVSILSELISSYKKFNPKIVSRIRKKLIPDKKGAIAGYKGFIHWKKELADRGVNSEDILEIDPDFRFYLSTNAEAMGLVSFCKKNKIKQVCITAPPFHQIRAYISAVSALIQTNSTNLKFYSKQGASVSWNENVVHSQGIVTGLRREILRGEHDRIYKYNLFGKPLISDLEEIIEYMNRRG